MNSNTTIQSQQRLSHGILVNKSGVTYPTKNRRNGALMVTKAYGAPLLVLAGPSGVGKGTLLKKLHERFPNIFASSVSYTSRKPRPGEVCGKDYFFVSTSFFHECINRHMFIEYTETYGNYYGTAFSELERIQKMGRICILEIDLEGVQRIQDSSTEVHFIYIYIRPPSLAALERRLSHRSTEDPKEIATRLAVSSQELERAQTMHFDCILVNDNLDQCYEALEKNIIKLYTPFYAFPVPITHDH